MSNTPEMNIFALSLTNVLSPIMLVVVGAVTAKIKYFSADLTHLFMRLMHDAALPFSLLYVVGWQSFSGLTMSALITYVVYTVLLFVVGYFTFPKQKMLGV